MAWNLLRFKSHQSVRFWNSSGGRNSAVPADLIEVIRCVSRIQRYTTFLCKNRQLPGLSKNGKRTAHILRTDSSDFSHSKKFLTFFENASILDIPLRRIGIYFDLANPRSKIFWDGSCLLVMILVAYDWVSRLTANPVGSRGGGGTFVHRGSAGGSITVALLNH